jgi:hypothetical protein
VFAYPWLGLRDYVHRLAFEDHVDKSALRDELLRALGMKALISGGRRGLFAAGLCLAFEPLVVRLAYIFKVVRSGFRDPGMRFVKRPARLIGLPRF